jgi:hypothetical protein
MAVGARFALALLGVVETGGGGGVALCESTVEWGLAMRSDTVDADDDESMLMVLFELVGESCCMCWLSGL